MTSRRDFMLGAALGGAAATLNGCKMFGGAEPGPQLEGGRFITINSIIRVNQIEASRNSMCGADESALHTPEGVRKFSEAVRDAIPGAHITWALSWLALHDNRPNYCKIRNLVKSYHWRFGDTVTFIPGGYFAPMYSSREQVNADIHEALELIRKMVGHGYNPDSLEGGFLAADNLRYLAEQEDIHVAQGTIWSQYGIDNGDGDGSICYPYYPSREHACKPAQGKADFIDCVNLDGWTVDFLCARRFGYEGGFNSRLGIGPIEAYGQKLDVETGKKEVLSVTAEHFSDEHVKRNGFGWLTVCWELSLVTNPKTKHMTDCLTWWLQEAKKRWPNVRVPTQGEFGLLWRKEHPDNENMDYCFVRRGSGIGGSDKNLELTWRMNKDFRLALLRDWEKKTKPMVIDFTRYDLPAKEPADPERDHPTRNWSLINRINQKHRRPEDEPIPVTALTSAEKELIRKRVSKER